MKSVSITSVRLLRLTVVIVALLLWLGNTYRVGGAPPEPVLQPTATSQPSGDESDVEPEISHQLFLSSPALPGVAPIQNAAPAITNNPIQLLATVGHWAGTTSQARPMSFDVLASGNQWDNFRVQATFSNCNVIVTYTLIGPGSINNNQFSGVSTDGVFSFSGQFNSANTANGIFNFFNISIPGCGNRSQSGTWTATIGPTSQFYVYLPIVLKSLPPPPDGQWTGTTSRSQPMSFYVSDEGKTLQNFKLKTTFSNGGCSGTLEVTIGGIKTIKNNKFSHSDATFSFSGQLTSLTTANGTYAFVNQSTGCGLLTQSGTWSAQLP